MLKTLNKVGLERTHLNKIKTICEKSTANLILNGKKRSRTRQRCSLLALLFNIVVVLCCSTPVVLTIAIREEEEIKDIQIGKRNLQNLHYLQMM